MMAKERKTKRKYTRSTEPKKHVPVKLEETDLAPHELADLLEAGSDPLKALMTAARQCGLDEKITRRMIDRMRSEFQPVLGEMRKVKTTEMVAALEDRAYRALMYMDDYNYAKASVKDLAIVAGIMLEKRALIRGEPTQILSIEDRSNMNELLSKLLQEAQKRGMFVDVIEGMVDVTPGDADRDYRPRTKMSLNDRKAKKAQQRRDDEGDPT